MNKNPVKYSANEEKGKSKEEADRVADEENTKHKGKTNKRSDKDGTVLGEINDD